MNTWDYLQKFGKPITLSQLEQRLIGNRSRKVDSDLIKMVGQKLIQQEEYDRVFKKVYLEKILIAKQAAKVWRRIPYISMLAVTGSVASGYPEEDDDVDIFFVCQKDRLWLCRVLVYLCSKLYGVEIRHPGSEEKNRMCLNLWLETDSLLIPKRKRNLKNAMDSIMVEVLYGYNVAERFFETNNWIKQFMANGYAKKIIYLRENRTETKLPDKKHDSRMGRTLNNICYWLSYWYMKKRGRELINKKQAFFHP